MSFMLFIFGLFLFKFISKENFKLNLNGNFIFLQKLHKILSGPGQWKRYRDIITSISHFLIFFPDSI